MRYLLLLLCLLNFRSQGTPENFTFLSHEEKTRILAMYGQPGDTLNTAWARYISAKVAAAKKERGRKPSGILFAPAEYGKAKGVCFSWKGYGSLLKPLIKEVSLDAKAYVVVSAHLDSVRWELEDYGCNMGNVELIDTRLNSVWMRDYGPWFLYTQDGDREIVDLVYNRPRPQDDKFPSYLAKHLQIKAHLCSLVLPGGNLILDGQGTAILTDVVFDAKQGGNPKLTMEELRGYMRDYFGCHTVYILEDMQKDGTGHIDMFCKLLDRRTLIVGKYEKPSDGAGDNYYILNRNAEKLAGCKNGQGENFVVRRIPMPPYDGNTRTYTNSLIVNSKVLVPIYDSKYDTQALNIYRGSLPGYEIIGYDCNSIIGANGAIHCITKLVMDDPLQIIHLPTSEVSENEKIDIEVEIHALGKIIPNGVSVHWKTAKKKNFSALNMESFDSIHYFVELSVPENAEKIEYFIRAEDEKGMYETLPEDDGGIGIFTVVVKPNSRK